MTKQPTIKEKAIAVLKERCIHLEQHLEAAEGNTVPAQLELQNLLGMLLVIQSLSRVPANVLGAVVRAI